MAGAPAGGAELFFERLTAALHRAGDEVLPVIRRDRGRAARLQAAGLGPVQLRFGGALDCLTRPLLARALRRFAPLVVVAWMSRAASMTPRGNWVSVGRLGGYYDLRYFRRCDHLVGNTRALASWIRDQGWPAERVHYLPNFAPDFAPDFATEFARDLAGAAPAPRPPGPTVLALGRLHRNKGFDLLIRALPRLPGVHAMIAGEGPEREPLQDLARREGVADRVHLLGWRTDQAALLAACDVLVCPSRVEPLGNVVLEAFSAGRPVVAAAVAGPVELIRPGQSGILVPPGDPAALADGLGAVLDDQGYASRLAEAGRATYEAEYAEAPVLQRWRATLAALAPG